MSLHLIKKDNDSVKYTGSRYRRDYDNLKLYKKLKLISDVEELINLETKLTLIEELEKIKNKEKKDYDDFIKTLKLKRILKYGY